MRIASLQNRRVKAAAALRGRRGRKNQGRTIVDGLREIERAIQASGGNTELFVCPEKVGSDKCRGLLAAWDRLGVEIIEVAPAVYDKLAFGERTDGMVATVRVPERRLGAIELPATPLVAVLEGIEKPGNIGAVVRTADAAGASAVIVTGDGTDLFNPNAIRASQGCVFTLPVCEAGADEIQAWLGEKGLAVYAARVEAERNYTSADFSAPAAVVLGSEARGLSSRWSPLAATPIRLPMLGAADSLNVSTTAAVLLYEALRQRSG